MGKHLGERSSFGQEIEPVFVRRNVTGRPTFKTKPFSIFKAARPDTSFYEDCHEIYKQLLAAKRRVESINRLILISSEPLSDAFQDVHPILTRAGKVAEALEEEARLVPEIWRRFVTKKYLLTPIQQAMYSSDLLHYRPVFIPGEGEETERPFMEPSTRKLDDIARAEARAEEMEIKE